MPCSVSRRRFLAALPVTLPVVFACTLGTPMARAQGAPRRPSLEPIRIGLFYKHQRLSGAGLMLVDSLISHMDEAAVPDRPKAGRAG